MVDVLLIKFHCVPVAWRAVGVDKHSCVAATATLVIEPRAPNCRAWLCVHLADDAMLCSCRVSRRRL